MCDEDECRHRHRAQPYRVARKRSANDQQDIVEDDQKKDRRPVIQAVAQQWLARTSMCRTHADDRTEHKYQPAKRCPCGRQPFEGKCKSPVRPNNFAEPEEIWANYNKPQSPEC